MFRAVARFCLTLALATALAHGAAGGLVSLQAASADAERARAFLAVRAAVRCTAQRVGALPARVDPDALPGLCRTLAGEEALTAAARGHGLGYRRLSAGRYRLCGAFHDPSAPPPLARLGLDPLGCVEERLAPSGGPFRPWMPRRRV
ncbi:MAG: hypothetical protein D6686_04570 [Alphaproteobacteria bacterium]|nr:MAG: hypothetical protein D6686_04570 [Alphaproteobacteria bacterium]